MKHVVPTLAAVLFATTTSAATLNINSIDTSFESAIGGFDVGYTTSTNGNSTVSWGDPFETDQSGYALDVGVAPSQATDGETFQLAEFTHFNRVIYSGTSITGVEMDITLDLSVDLDDGAGFRDIGEQTFEFMVDHNETPNNPSSGICEPDGSSRSDAINANGCADVVDIMGAVGSSSFILDGFEFTLNIIGFLDTATQTISQSFFSMENNSNTRVLIAEFVVTPVTTEVPIPAGGLLLIGGLGALGVLRRRRKT